MKKIGKIVAILLVSLVYGGTINIGIYSGFFLGNQTNKSSEQEEYYAIVTQNITCHSSQSENVVPCYKNFPTQSLKICYKEFFALNIIFDHLFETKISQTSQLLRTLHLQQHKFEIIYPFHYFW